MNKLIFFAWIRRLKDYIDQTKDRNIILFIDNCSAHGAKESLPALQHVDVPFLSPKTTSHIQPLYAVIIAVLNAKLLATYSLWMLVSLPRSRLNYFAAFCSKVLRTLMGAKSRSIK